MNKTIFVVLFLQFFDVFGIPKTIPSFIPLCKRNDPELAQCFIKSFYEMRPYLIKGVPELDLPPGQPLHYLNATANTGRGTALTLEVEVWDQIATGLMDVDIKNLTIDLDKARFSATLVFPLVRLQGVYKFKGKILLLAIDTVGKFDINSTEVVADVDWIGNFHTKKGKQYMEFEKVDLYVKFKTCTVYFSELIKGNAAITETLNQAINQNINTIKEELDPIIGNTLGGIAQQYFNKFFRLFSVDELFPRD